MDELRPLPLCADETNALGFAPATGTTITVGEATLTATGNGGRVGSHTEITALGTALVSDLLDPVTGAAQWNVDGLTLELAGPPGVEEMRIGLCERSWSTGDRSRFSVPFSISR